jgi:protein O-GlcNAc transferase
MRQGIPAVQEMLALALRHHQAGRLPEAERLYGQILEADPRHADALHFLGVIAHQLGRNDVAVQLIGKAIAQRDTVPAFHNNLGNALKALGKLNEALASYRRALAIKPDYAQTHYNLGVTLQAQGELDEAAASYARALSLNPHHAHAHNNFGNVLQAQGKLNEAVASYGRALAIEPNYLEAHNNLGNVLKLQGRLTEAVASYSRALSLKPDSAEAHANLGNVLLEQEKLEEAVACYERAVACNPDYAQAYSSLGEALKENGKLDEALASYRRALALQPDLAVGRLGLAVASIPIFAANVADSKQATEKFARSLDDLEAWSRANPEELGASVGRNQPFFLAYRPADVTGLLARYGDVVCAAAQAHRQPVRHGHRAIDSPRERVRVAVVSGQVRQHPVWEIILRGIIAHTDRRKFQIFLYHTGAIVDEETNWARAQVERFVAGPKPIGAWLEEVKQDRPDVLLYPEVGMDPATCALAALRLAPLQVASWGHPVTTGLPSMDLFLSGELLEGPQAERHYREKLVRLPGTGVCTQSTAVQPQPWGGPGRPKNVLRFALCQQPIKFDPADDVLFPRIAKAVGPCEFWLASPQRHHWATTRLQERLAAAFRAEGLDPNAYLRVMPWLRRNKFLAFLDDMDVYLDCPGFSGYTTAWQAVHCGVPIVTMEGEFLRQRLAAGLLRQTGMPDGIASSRDEYINLVVQYAQESRQLEHRAARREAVRGVAYKADGNRPAIHAFEQTLIEALNARA